MSNPASILVFGRDPSLLETRRLVLQSTGGVVHATSKLAEAEQFLDREHPDLVVLCYTLSAEERAAILTLTERLGGRVKTLTLAADGMPDTGEDVHDIFSGARAFKSKVVKVLRQNFQLNKQQYH